jgi:hypothetical protein
MNANTTYAKRRLLLHNVQHLRPSTLQNQIDFYCEQNIGNENDCLADWEASVNEAQRSIFPTEYLFSIKKSKRFVHRDLKCGAISEDEAFRRLVELESLLQAQNKYLRFL